MDEGACKMPCPNWGADQSLKQVVESVEIPNPTNIKTLARCSPTPFNPPIGIKAAIMLATVRRIQGTINRNKVISPLSSRIMFLNRVIREVNRITLRCRGPLILPNQLDLLALSQDAKP